MSDKLWGKIEEFLMALGLIIAAVMIIAFITYVPFGMHTKAECLSAGYPKAKVSIWLERYCVNLDGDVFRLIDGN